MPDLSVILPARDAAGTIARAVTSTLRALPDDAELVVLDDGSSDDTAARAQDAAERVRATGASFRVETSAEGSGGVAPALNRLLQLTDSRLVGRMDADDVTLPGRFTRGLRAISRGEDVVFHQIIEFGARTRPMAPTGISAEAFPLHLLLTNPVSHPTMLSRRELLDGVGGYRSVPAEDYDLWLRLAASGARLTRLAAWGLLYRIHPDQVTASSQWRGRSWSDPAQAQAYADLSEQLTGERLPRIVQLPAMPRAERLRVLDSLDAAVTERSAALSRSEQALLRRRLDKRRRWALAAPEPRETAPAAPGTEPPEQHAAPSPTTPPAGADNE